MEVYTLTKCGLQMEMLGIFDSLEKAKAFVPDLAWEELCDGYVRAKRWEVDTESMYYSSVRVPSPRTILVYYSIHRQQVQ